MPTLLPKTCPLCRSPNLYCRETPAGGGNGISLLSGLGGFLNFAYIVVVICADCGHTLIFADNEALEKLPASSHWRRLS